MTDRELLEKAARAAGLVVVEERSGGLPWTVSDDKAPRRTWNPLTDDGDALRLAVKLRIDLLMDGHDVEAPCIEALSSTDAEARPFAIETLDTGDAFAATRRAIVRCAAAMSDAAGAA